MAENDKISVPSHKNWKGIISSTALGEDSCELPSKLAKIKQWRRGLRTLFWRRQMMLVLLRCIDALLPFAVVDSELLFSHIHDLCV